MARKCPQYDSDDELPELDEIINRHLSTKLSLGTGKANPGPIETSRARITSPRKTTASIVKSTETDGKLLVGSERRPRALSTRLEAGRPVRLLPVTTSTDQSLRGKNQSLSTKSPAKLQSQISPIKARATPGRTAKRILDYGVISGKRIDSSEVVDFEESIWCDGSSDSGDAQESCSPISEVRPLILRRTQDKTNNNGSLVRPLSDPKSRNGSFTPTKPTRTCSATTKGQDVNTNSSSDQENDNVAILRL